MSKAAKPLSELRTPFERYSDSGEINTVVHDVGSVLSGFASRYRAEGAAIDELDGLTIDLGSWWFNLRASNTEPLLRLNLEANNAEDCSAHVADVVALIRALDDADDSTTGS
jgi:phosphomannomutase